MRLFFPNVFASLFLSDGENNCCIHPTLEGWVHIEPTHGPLDEPLYTWAQYTPTLMSCSEEWILFMLPKP